jgi:hypothetical protein
MDQPDLNFDVVVSQVDLRHLRGWVVSKKGVPEFVEADEARAVRHARRLADTHGVRCFRVELDGTTTSVEYVKRNRRRARR